MKYVRFEKATGRILDVGDNSPPAIPAMITEYIDVLTDVYTERDDVYVVNNEIVDRPPLGPYDEYTVTADGVDSVALDFPIFVNIIYKGQIHESTRSMSFLTDKPGDYEFQLVPVFPYLEQKVVIHAIPFVQ